MPVSSSVSSSSVLIFGHDSSLLKTRCWMLEQRGLRASTATTLADLRECLKANPFTVLVLCHTLSAAECAEAVAIAHIAQPWPATIALTNVLGVDPPCDRTGTTPSVRAEPRAFLTATAEAMRRASGGLLPSVCSLS